ncbi:MAG: M20/M25/M40 family metallo-hydrolase [Candidatus Sericytochromatia bacterium]|nr:M20/M25/M40 family metallo-hydrolase [Candidatus Sericytochromatia bacterium]
MRAVTLATTLAILLAGPVAAGSAAPAEDEAVLKLRAYLRVPTVNPPGAEEAGARLIASWLKAEGLAPELVRCAPGRAAVFATLRGTGAERPLMLLHHIDVVPVERSRWRHEPFGGELRDGAIWGRGALDMKGLGVMMAVAFLRLHRERRPLRRDVVLAATPDEEAGGDVGVRWLLAHEPRRFDVSEVLNEGGAGLMLKRGRSLMGVQTAERGALWVRATAHGDTGHGSRERPDSAPRRLLRAMARLEASRRPLAFTPETRAMLAAFADAEEGLPALALRAVTWPGFLPLLGPRLIAAEPALGPLLGDTLNPTVLRAGEKTNVMPGAASAELDMRLLPGHPAAEALAWLQAATAVPGDPPLTWVVLHQKESSSSPAAGPLWDGLTAGVAAVYPDTPVLPILTPGGGTDSAFLRPLGIKALGCLPILASQAQIDTIHGDDEHLTVEQLQRGTEVVYRALVHAAGL